MEGKEGRHGTHQVFMWLSLLSFCGSLRRRRFADPSTFADPDSSFRHLALFEEKANYLFWVDPYHLEAAQQLLRHLVRVGDFAEHSAQMQRIIYTLDKRTNIQTWLC